ncbi:tight junction protein ZO-2-like [Sinocyclocheilus rhinocerous]|uniref:tight junction protein ZO-2-like n=1 Tax=Sinocyclocheilus rhinocerous TaxID=307959 RepID=UPI0007B98607|nr:PREDICTED: tight junction protein ZO-2-like [Sinocyclocheilus rhinocerous]
MLSQLEVSRGQYDPSRYYDSRSSSPVSSEHPRSQDSPAKTKPPPPPTALKPTYVSRTSRGLLNSPPVRDSEPLEDSPDDPSKRSFLGKVKAFEQMDHLARTQKVLEIQEAQNARLEIAQKHPDIYAVPMKSQKLDHSRPQPIGSSARPEPQTPPCKLPYTESRPLGLGKAASTRAARTLPGLLNSPPVRDSEPLEDSPDDPSKRSFLGKVKAFEQMDHLARTQKVLEIQEAQNARLEIAQKHPDIYAVPMKSQNLLLSFYKPDEAKLF